MKRFAKRACQYALTAMLVVLGGICQSAAMVMLHMLPGDTEAAQPGPAVLLLVIEVAVLLLAAMRTFHPLYMPRD